MEAKKCDDALLKQFDSLNFHNKVVLTDGFHPGIRSGFPIKKGFYDRRNSNGTILSFPKLGLRRYIDSFDYVYFFNKGVIRRRFL